MTALNALVRSLAKEVVKELGKDETFRVAHDVLQKTLDTSEEPASET